MAPKRTRKKVGTTRIAFWVMFIGLVALSFVFSLFAYRTGDKEMAFAALLAVSNVVTMTATYYFAIQQQKKEG